MANVRAKTYKRPGGVLAIPREMFRSPAYRALSLPARCLLLEVQDCWRPDHPAVHFSTRRAVEALGVSLTTASRAFKELVTGGFLRVATESDLIERRAREYLPTWLPNHGREPTDDWRGINGAKTHPAFHQSNSNRQICYPSITEAPRNSCGQRKNQ